jgi:cytochrome c oxidase accessory protein FixG
MSRIIPIQPISESEPPKNNDDEEVVQSLYEVSQKVYPRAVSGVFARWRIVFVILTQLIYYGLPWVNWNNRQAVLFDLVSRKFYIFGLVLWPQDVIYLTLLLLISALSLFLFTAIAGRLFCGYACPQTVYTEIFMWIEQKIEGDRPARMRLDAEKLSVHKLRLKATKHLLWLIVAAWTGFTFVGYFTSITELVNGIKHLNLGAWEWFWIFFYSFATWGNAGYMREQVCKYMCPYARFQSVMFDQDTLIISYDAARGEPRGGRSKKADYKSAGLGDCIDCHICVQVCPTNIDIRNGLQYECIGCAACIDACDQVMDKLNYPKGLIRYSTERALKAKLPADQTESSIVHHLFRPRLLIYAALLTVICVAFMGSLVLRKPFRVDIIRDRGALAREIPGEWVENVYRLQIMNHSEYPLDLNVSLEGLPSLVSSEPGKIIHLEPSHNLLIPFKLRAKEHVASAGLHKIYFHFEAIDSHRKIYQRDEQSVFVLPE